MTVKPTRLLIALMPNANNQNVFNFLLSRRCRSQIRRKCFPNSGCH